MKRFIVILSAILLICFVFVDSYAFAEENGKSSDNEDSYEVAQPTDETQATASADSNDPNLGRRRFAGLQDAIAKLDSGDQDEVRQWMRIRMEKRVAMMKDVQGRYTKELNFIRSLAMKENAMETVSAIDQLLEKKIQRMEKVLEEIDKEKRRLHRQELAKQKEQGKVRPSRGERTRSSGRKVRSDATNEA